ncbi:MAG TPA: type II secretion system minor pseudopilin GspK, partial [Rhodocyclaceae bacterium]|nr:type II secretion system minor pseudopilin GspK [Rhodocyclaceae bacterium]
GQAQVDVFIRLLVSQGTSTDEADRLAQAVVDWVDGDTVTRDGAAELAFYGVAPDNQRLLGVGSLLGIPGFTPALVARLQPFVSALPPGQPLNLNTAPAEVLAAELPALGLAAAQRVVADRERAPFLDVADFNARFIGAGAGAACCGVASKYFLATTRSSYGESVVQLRTLLYRGTPGQWPDILWQQTL